LFHNKDGAYATAFVKGHRETWPIGSSDFRLYLGKLYWEKYRDGVTENAMQQARATLAARALYDGPEQPVHYRVAHSDGKIYVDLGNKAHNIVEISSQGWEIVQNAPVRFVRHKNMLALPMPAHGGSLDELRPFINVEHGDDFVLVKSFLVGIFQPAGPFVFLALKGEQGSAKSSAAEFLKSLIDPTIDQEWSLIKDDRTLAIAAQANWVLNFGNVSYVSPEVSDTLCRLSTGGGHVERKLYTDDESKRFAYKRPVILNGIGEVVARPDLMDRTMAVRLAVITDDKRKDETTLKAEFEATRPKILGALFNHVAAGLRDLGDTRLAKMPRMADFARWAVAAEIDPQFLRFTKTTENNYTM
jgi:hypothetical protein